LKLNRDKTRCFDARQPGQTLDFLGYSFRYERDLFGRARRWWRLFPSRKAVDKQRAMGCGKIINRQPLLRVAARSDRSREWGICEVGETTFALGHPQREYRKLNFQLMHRLSHHRPNAGVSGLSRPENLSLYGPTCTTLAWYSCECSVRNTMRLLHDIRMRENPHVRFDEGRATLMLRINGPSLLYWFPAA